MVFEFFVDENNLVIFFVFKRFIGKKFFKNYIFYLCSDGYIFVNIF